MFKVFTVTAAIAIVPTVIKLFFPLNPLNSHFIFADKPIHPLFHVF